jgi:hypothetical protein
MQRLFSSVFTTQINQCASISAETQKNSGQTPSTVPPLRAHNCHIDCQTTVGTHTNPRSKQLQSNTATQHKHLPSIPHSQTLSNQNRKKQQTPYKHFIKLLEWQANMFVLQAAKRKVMSPRRGRNVAIASLDKQHKLPIQPQEANSAPCPTTTIPTDKLYDDASEIVAINHFCRGLRRVAMYNDNSRLPSYMRLPGADRGKLEPFAHARHCPSAEFQVEDLLCELRVELNQWWSANTNNPTVDVADHKNEDSPSSVAAPLESDGNSFDDPTAPSLDQTRPDEPNQCDALSPGMQVILVAMIYLNRLTRYANGRVRLCSKTMHRLVLLAMQLAAQEMWSKKPSTEWFADKGSVEYQETRELKHTFGTIVKNLQVPAEQFQRCVDKCLKLGDQPINMK